MIFLSFFIVTNMADDSDDELPTLSAETFAALKQFYTEEVSEN